MLRRIQHQQGAMLTTLGIFFAIIMGMVLISVPVVRHARATNHAEACTLNLAKLLAAKEHYVLNHDLKRGDNVEIDELLKGNPPLLKVRPVCPDGGVYTLNAAGALPVCSVKGHILPMAEALLKRAPVAVGTVETTTTVAGK